MKNVEQQFSRQWGHKATKGNDPHERQKTKRSEPCNCPTSRPGERVQAVLWGMGRKAEAGKQLKDQAESWETGLSSVPSTEHPRGEKAPERELSRPLERLTERRAGPASTWGNSMRPGKERPGGKRDSPGHMRGHGAGKSAVPASQTEQLAFTMRNAKPFTLHAPVPWSKSGKQDTQKKLVI